MIQRSRRVSPELKATYHHVTGAGKSHVRRPFFDLNAEDEAVMLKKVQDYLDRAIR